jgi:hypothetical protein
MFPILNVSNNKGFNQMSSLKEQIDAMTPEQVMAEMPLAKTELQRTSIMRVLLYVVFALGLGYLVFGM